MLTTFSYYDDHPEAIKLSKAHRRIFPLSLFPSPGSESPRSSFTPIRTENLSHFSHKKPIKRHLIPVPVTKLRTQSTIVPRIDYKSIKDSCAQTDLSQNRYFYQPCSIKISPRSRVTIYSTSPFGTEPVKKEKKRVKTKGKCTVEIFDEPKQPLKLKRITSSKITFPSINIGQVMLRVKDLVLDPLKLEISEYNRKCK